MNSTPTQTPEAPDRREPRRNGFLSFNSTFWMAVGWVLVALLVVFPFPWW